MKKSISIIGGGPAAMAVAAFLHPMKYDITIYEKNKSLGRKFLVAGKGGFNLTHSEPIENLINRYTPSLFLKRALLHFDNVDLRTWLEKMGIGTFIGSSKRVYPLKGIKPIEVLNAILKMLALKGVLFQYEQNWTGWNKNGDLLFNNKNALKTDYVIFALGGGSWKVTGSDGGWLSIFKKYGIHTSPFQASNCAFKIDWDKEFITKHAGTPLKNIAIRCKAQAQKGEAVITNFGLEGNALYALSPTIREELNTNQTAQIYIDLKPMLSAKDVHRKLEHTTLEKTSDILREVFKMNPTQIDLIKCLMSKEDFMKRFKLENRIKNIELEIKGYPLIDEAISTVGGISLHAVDKHYQLLNLPHQYCIGEMLDYDAPTGGYLLQASFSMGAYLAHHFNSFK